MEMRRGSNWVNVFETPCIFETNFTKFEGEVRFGQIFF